LNASTLTGFWSASGNNIYNDNSGNVGINNTNPQYKLDVINTLRINAGSNDTINSGMSEFLRYSSTGTHTVDYQVTTNSSAFNDYRWIDTRFVYNSIGNTQVWGIVTSTASNLMSQSTLGSIRFFHNVQVDGELGIGVNSNIGYINGPSSINYFQLSTNGVSDVIRKVDIPNGTLAANAIASASGRNNSASIYYPNATNQLYITNYNGNISTSMPTFTANTSTNRIGINNSTPQYALDVTNAIRINAGSNDTFNSGMSEFVRSSSSNTRTIDYQVTTNSTSFGYFWIDSRYVYNDNVNDNAPVWGIITSTGSNLMTNSTIGNIRFFQNAQVDGNLSVLGATTTTRLACSTLNSDPVSWSDYYGKICFVTLSGAVLTLTDSPADGTNILFKNEAGGNITINTSTPSATSNPIANTSSLKFVYTTIVGPGWYTI
jgi:hypothetical protein